MQAAYAAWSAAAERHPQAIAFDDPNRLGLIADANVHVFHRQLDV